MLLPSLSIGVFCFLIYYCLDATVGFFVYLLFSILFFFILLLCTMLGGCGLLGMVDFGCRVLGDLLVCWDRFAADRG